MLLDNAARVALYRKQSAILKTLRLSLFLNIVLMSLAIATSDRSKPALTVPPDLLPFKMCLALFLGLAALTAYLSTLWGQCLACHARFPTGFWRLWDRHARDFPDYCPACKAPVLAADSFRPPPAPNRTAWPPEVRQKYQMLLRRYRRTQTFMATAGTLLMILYLSFRIGFHDVITLTMSPVLVSQTLWVAVVLLGLVILGSFALQVTHAQLNECPNCHRPLSERPFMSALKRDYSQCRFCGALVSTLFSE